MFDEPEIVLIKKTTKKLILGKIGQTKLQYVL